MTCATCFPGPCEMHCAEQAIARRRQAPKGASLAECRATIAALEGELERLRVRVSALDKQAWNEGALTARVEVLEAQLRDAGITP